ncbi:MAG: hypothetical protein IJV43_06795, partial [Oscillospiraceae bacterium]|nr:hypothetical protein [Oscillospiraceae bacterium]MBQ9721140.1 hypothetical protein [Oscillospiraceae bacterium]
HHNTRHISNSVSKSVSNLLQASYFHILHKASVFLYAAFCVNCHIPQLFARGFKETLNKSTRTAICSAFPQ